jgi:hypothetical protein
MVSLFYAGLCFTAKLIYSIYNTGHQRVNPKTVDQYQTNVFIFGACNLPNITVRLCKNRATLAKSGQWAAVRIQRAARSEPAQKWLPAYWRLAIQGKAAGGASAPSKILGSARRRNFEWQNVACADKLGRIT